MRPPDKMLATQRGVLVLSGVHDEWKNGLE
jgi:hypothetical protein